ncbi:MAG: SDR family NAD(P)-dependent oxidoreductase [Dehalococcoidales bacterium]|nr:SDR family NAD(P)-dependent oxidoreductase [Dehalococcoidales bacterium]
MEDLLKDRIAVVTGAGGGIGKAEALGLAARGAKVVVNDIGTSHDGLGISDDPADRTVEEIIQAGGTAIASHDSVADEKGANAIIRLAMETFGRLDILINNAGILRVAPVYDIETEDFDAVIKTHLYGTFYCTRAACEIMKEQDYGRIVCTSSHTGFGLEDQAMYSAAKEGIAGFARTVARDMVKFGVTCNIIRPIALWRGKPFKALENDLPEDIAALVVYLASEPAGDINGCIFEVWHGHVGIFAEPPPVQQILWKDGRWTPEELKKLMPETLTRGRTSEDLPQTMPFMLNVTDQEGI